MLNVAVLVSGGGTNLQAILDAKAAGALPHAKIALVLASKPGVYALERASKAGVPGIVVARKSYAAPEEYDAALLAALREHRIDVVVLAGFLSILGPSVITAYPERILNVHPSLIPSFAGEPEHVRLMGDIDTFTRMVWNSLNEDNKVSLFVRYIDLATGKTQDRIVNKYEKV